MNLILYTYPIKYIATEVMLVCTKSFQVFIYVWKCTELETEGKIAYTLLRNGQAIMIEKCTKHTNRGGFIYTVSSFFLFIYISI